MSELVFKAVGALAATVAILAAVARWLDGRIQRGAKAAIEEHDASEKAHSVAITRHDQNPDAHLHLAILTQIREDIRELKTSIDAADMKLASDAAEVAMRKLIGLFPLLQSADRSRKQGNGENKHE